MMRKIRARYSKGIIVQTEVLDLEEEAKLFIDVSVAYEGPTGNG